MRIMVQLRHSGGLHAAAAGFAAPVGVDAVAAVASVAGGFKLDAAFPPVKVPGVGTPTGTPFSTFTVPHLFLDAPEQSSYVVRGSVPDGHEQEAALRAVRGLPGVTGVFADPKIERCLVCPGSPPVGTAGDVAQRLGVSSLAARGLDGRGVYLAIVDTGINLAHLRARGQRPRLDVAHSFTPAGVLTTPGRHPVDHGTMCAYDAAIAAPGAKVLDHAVLSSVRTGATAMEGLLSDAVLSYARLRSVLQAMLPARRAMVVSNSWGMFDPAWDFPPGHPGNYSDNPNHPFNVIVANLEAEGADILFAAGNCGRDCPDGRCAFGASMPICGANSHPKVLSIAGVEVATYKRVGYSSQGPGRLSNLKPDVSAYTHFAGSGVYPADGGTSAACPVAAGAIAALRTRFKATSVSPASMRAILQRTALDRGAHGFDYDYGWGIVQPLAALAHLHP